MTIPSSSGAGATALVIGEAFVDLIAQDDERGRVYVPKFGGSPLNVAVGLCRLGTPVQLASTVAPGAFGAALGGFCEREGVDIAALSTPVERMFLSVATPVDGHVEYEYFGDLSSLTSVAPISEEHVRSAAVVHASSTAFLGDPVRSTVRRAYLAATGYRTMDPNPRPSLIGDKQAYLDALTGLYGLVDLVKVSDEDLAYLVPGVPAAEAAKRIHREHDAVVIVTRAASPTLLVTDGQVLPIDVPPTVVVDATGAGDSFMASVLADIAQHGVPATVSLWTSYIRRANAAAARTCRTHGGAESMPSAATLDRGDPAPAG